MLESTFHSLFDSAVRAFPATTKRQHATDTVEITNLKWTPFLGLKTLYVRGLAQNEGREYRTALVFKGVRYRDRAGVGVVPLRTEGRIYFVEPLSLEGNHVLVRCDCGDFHWRFQHLDKLDRSLQGPDRKRYEALFRPGSSNPLKLPGLCKHLMVLADAVVGTRIAK